MGLSLDLNEIMFILVIAASPAIAKHGGVKNDGSSA